MQNGTKKNEKNDGKKAVTKWEAREFQRIKYIILELLFMNEKCSIRWLRILN